MAIARTTMKRPLDKDLKQTIQKRNFRLAKFWELVGLDVEVIGDMETPAVIKDDYCLACYVHNFNLIFTDHYDQGKEVYRVKLQKDQVFDMEPIVEWLKTATHRRIYRVKMKGDLGLYLVGYNFGVKKEHENMKYPVYGKYSPKVFFTKDYADEVMELYNLHEYCEVI
ncbi:MAG: hypothetical protein R2831_05985 [Chitinophagaceae bacterium]